MNSFYTKYLKYKNKYLKIKKQIGGMRNTIVTYKGRTFPVLLPDDLFCHVTGKPSEDPVITKEGITYERSLYSPKSGESPPELDLVVKKRLEELLEEAYKKKEQEICLLQAKVAAGEYRAMNELGLKYLSGKDFLEHDIDRGLDLINEAMDIMERAREERLREKRALSAQASSMQVQLFPELQRALADGQIRRSVEEINMLTGQIFILSAYKKKHMDDEVAEKRRMWCEMLGYSIPSTDVTDTIVKHVGKDSVLSLAAGLAAQETLLAAKGVNIVCTDLDPPKDSFMPVERLNNDDAVAKWRSHCEVAMLVWPDYIRRNWYAPRGTQIPDCHTYEALLKGNFSKIIYIGEKRGCTGSEQLEDFLRENYNDIELTEDEKLLPRWPNIKDYLRIFIRKSDGVVPVPKNEEN